MREILNDSEARTLDMAGGGEMRRFTMKADGWLFRNLMGGLYSDKIGSVIREIIANALDAQAMSKRLDKAVEVQLPSSFDPTFSVRDYGNGMDREFMLELYSCVGHSEKRGTNVATGMFGLGSKAPFAITESFEVWVYQGGKRTIYSTFYDVDGAPAIKEMGTYPTTEADGVCVKVPVPAHNVGEFEKAVKKNAFAYYDKNIKFSRKLTGSQEEVMAVVKRAVIEFVPGMFQLTVPDSESRGRSYTGGAFIRQGAAIYPLEVAKLSNGYNSDRQKVMELLQKNDTAVLFDVPIGTFNVTPSRELIQYDDSSVKALTKMYATCVDAAAEKLAQCIGKARTYGEAYKAVIATYPTEVQDHYKTWNLASDLVKFGANIIRRNHKAWVAENAIEEDDKRSILSETMEISGQFFGPAIPVTMFSGNVSMGYGNQTRGTIDKTSRFVTSWPCIAIVVPHATRDWERRVIAWFGIHSPIKQFSDDGRSLPFFVVRAKAADVPLVSGILKRSNMFLHVCDDATQLPELPAEASSNVVTPTKRKRYAKNAVFKWTGSSWGDSKIEVDFSEPAYYVIRNASFSDNLMMSEDELKKFDAARHWHDIVPAASSDFSGRGIRVKTTVANSSINQFIKTGKAIQVIDDSLPIYRLTALQAARLLDMDDNDLVPLFQTVVEGLVQQRHAFIAAAKQEEFNTTSHYSLTGKVVSTLERLGDRKVPSDAILSLCRTALSDDTFAIGAAMQLLRSSVNTPNMIVGVSLRDTMMKNNVVLQAVRDIFTAVPAEEIPAVAKVSALSDTVKERFRLLNESRYNSYEDNGFVQHANYYVQGVIAAEKSPLTLDDMSELKVLVAAMRKTVNDALTITAKAA